MHRRTLLKGGTAIFATAISAAREARARPSPVLPDDKRFMQIAIDEAAKGRLSVRRRDRQGRRRLSRVVATARMSIAIRPPTARWWRSAPFSIAWAGGSQGRYALHVRRAVLHVHGRDHLVRDRTARLCSFARSAGDQDRSDHAVGGGRGVEGPFRADRYYGRRAFRECHAAVQVSRDGVL